MAERHDKEFLCLNPVALRKAKIVLLFECNRVTRDVPNIIGIFAHHVDLIKLVLKSICFYIYYSESFSGITVILKQQLSACFIFYP